MQVDRNHHFSPVQLTKLMVLIVQHGEIICNSGLVKCRCSHLRGTIFPNILTAKRLVKTSSWLFHNVNTVLSLSPTHERWHQLRSPSNLGLCHLWGTHIEVPLCYLLASGQDLLLSSSTSTISIVIQVCCVFVGTTWVHVKSKLLIFKCDKPQDSNLKHFSHLNLVK